MNNADSQELGHGQRMPAYKNDIERFAAHIKATWGNPSAFGRAVGLPATEVTKLYRCLKGTHVPGAEALLDWWDRAGAKTVFPSEVKVDPPKDVSFTPPQIVQAGDVLPPQSPDYLAVPLTAGVVAAGRGLVLEDAIKGWVIVNRHHESIQFRKNLIAVEVGISQDSMVPTIFPGDILLVDRDDFHTGFKSPGNIFLVRGPKNSEVIVKRVRVQQGSDGSSQVMFYCDNAMDYPPEVFSLAEHYGGEIARAVIGRVVWCWSDMSRR